MALAMNDERDGGGAPPFTDKQAAAIRKIAKKRGIPADLRADFVHDVWLEVNRCWARVPKQEPDCSRYVNGVAAHMAFDETKRRSTDALDDAERIALMPLGTPAPEHLPRDRKILAGQLVAAAVARDPQGADWMVRTTVCDEAPAAVAAEAGVPVERLRKRVARMLQWLRAHADGLVVVLLVLVLATPALLWALLHGGEGQDGHITADSSPPLLPRPQDVAHTLRDEAFSACAAGRWALCERKFDEAARLDPAGDSDPRVQRARRQAYDGQHPAPSPPDKSVPK